MQRLTSELAEAKAALAALDAVPEAPSEGSKRHTGKYKALWQLLRDSDQARLDMTFHEIEEALGFPLPPSSRKHPPHWYGYGGSAVARAVRDAGYRSSHIDMSAETVTFVLIAKTAA